MGFAISGTGSGLRDCSTASTCDAQALRYVSATSNSDNSGLQASATYVVSGLTSGASDTFTAKYRVSGGTGSYSNRNIVLIPLP
jgi:hypothetical protein